MRIFRGWLLLDNKDCITLALNYKSIKEVSKHFVIRQGRSYLHYPLNCAFCKAHIPIRPRFIAGVLYDGADLRWEYGNDVQSQISSLETFVDKKGFINLQVSRSGKGAKTVYRCVYIKEADAEILKYITGKYGHLVQR